VISELIVESKETIIVLTINRPEALNALHINMINGIHDLLDEWNADKIIEAALIHGAGERSFCAGGDIKDVHRIGQLWTKGEIEETALSDYFYREYRLNRALYESKLDIVAYMDDNICYARSRDRAFPRCRQHLFS
jgi:enoyl-CoA hydratase